MHIYRGLIGHMIQNGDQATYLLKLEGLYKRKPKTIFDSSLVFQGHSFLIFKNGFGNCLGCIQQLDGGNHSTHQTPLQSVHLQAQLLMTLYGPITWGSFCDKPPWWKITKPAPVTELEWILSKLVHIDISKDSPQFNYYGLDWKRTWHVYWWTWQWYLQPGYHRCNLKSCCDAKSLDGTNDGFPTLLHLCDWVLIFIFDNTLEDCCSKSTDNCSISSQHTVWFSTSSAMALINSSLSESPVQILLIRHLNSQLSDRLSFMEYIKSPESTQKETPQKSKSLKLCSCPHKFRTPIIWHKLISKKPTALLSTLRLRHVRLVPQDYQISSQPSFLEATFAETEVLFSSAKRC